MTDMPDWVNPFQQSTGKRQRRTINIFFSFSETDKHTDLDGLNWRFEPEQKFPQIFTVFSVDLTF